MAFIVEIPWPPPIYAVAIGIALVVLLLHLLFHDDKPGRPDKASSMRKRSDKVRKMSESSDSSDDSTEQELANASAATAQHNIAGASKLPREPHLECSLLPSTGVLYSNSDSAFPFENDFAKGHILPLHRPTYDKALDKSGDYKYGDHFGGRRRIWEMRFQFQFKVAPPENMNFGIQLEEYVPMSWQTSKAQSLTVGALKKVVGKDIYHSPGDDHKKCSGEIEKPVFVMPLWAYDQFIETAEGEEPPNLCDPLLSEKGVKRTDGRGAFIKQMSNLQLKPGPTYTFCFWGISQFLDVINWSLKQVIPGGLDFNKFCGQAPIHVVLYTLKPPEPGNEKEERHLESRKTYYFQLALWSSIKKPHKRIMDRILSGKPYLAKDPYLVPSSDADKKPSRGFGSFLTCCMDRRSSGQQQSMILAN